MKILLALIFSAAAFGQYFPDFDIGTQQESSSIDWKQVESSSFRVIYPDGLSEQAKRVLYVLEKTHKVNQANLKVGVKKIDIILRANTTISNGFVTLAPRRSEWFVTPFMDSALGAGYWTDMLAIHEYRHVVQLDALNQGFTEGVSYVLGETGRMFATFWSTPVWFMEGDAVVMESSLTSYGRGRLPEFEAKLKALFMEQPNFNLDKILLRSYEDYIPNHYVIGFYLVSYIKETYGKDELKKIVRESSYRSFNPFAFYNAIETVLEESIEDIYTQMRTYFLTQWKKKALSFPLSYFNEISPERSDGFENYRYAWPYQGGVVAYRNGFSSPGEIVFIKDRQESHIKTIGNITSSGIKKCGDLLTWSEYAPHHRWGYQDYSEIIIYDLKNRERRRLTNRGRFFAPAFSHDCLDIVAVSIDNKLNNSLVLIHTSSGEVYKKVLIPQNELLMHPFWIPKTRDIVAVRKDNKEGQLSLVSFNLDTQKMRTYIPPSFHMIANPVVAGDHIYFRWDFNGVDNIYSINLVNGKLAQKTSSKIGAYNPVVENDSLYYSDYHATGYKVYKTSISAFSRKPNENEASLFWGEKMAQEEGSGDLMKEVAKDINIYGHTPERSPEDNFSMIQNSLYPHSWFILAPPISSAIILQAVSSDIFQQFALTAGYSYDTNQKSGEVFAGISYAHHYPVFDLYLRDRKRATKFFEGETEKDHKYYRWREQELQTGISFIINHSSGAYMREMRLRPYLEMSRVDERPTPSSVALNDETLHGHGVSWSWSILKNMSQRDFYPRWGYDLIMNAKSGRVASDNTIGADIFSAMSTFYIPGLFSHNHLVLNAAYEYQNDMSYRYSSAFRFSRGYDSYYFDHLSLASANYTFPLWNADARIFDYIYFRRFGFNFFYDHLLGKNNGSSEFTFDSYGAELLVESAFFRNINLNLNWGIRYAQRLDLDEADSYELFLRTSF